MYCVRLDHLQAEELFLLSASYPFLARIWLFSLLDLEFRDLAHPLNFIEDDILLIELNYTS